MSKVKALVLLSGGLDSMLAARILLEQGVEVVGITFISSFFGAKRGLQAAKMLGVPLIAYNIAEKHLEMVKKPEHGYGKNMNPCIDCHSMMLREAKEILEGKEMALVYPNGKVKAVAQKYDFISTGEVLGQRPMSQNSRALKIVTEYSGVGELLVRPLSAKLLEVTAPEKEGKIEREKLLDISGRSRARQIELAKEYGISEYPSPAGGCLLTESDFSQKLRTLFEKWPEAQTIDCELLKSGRIFWLEVLGEKVLLAISRDEAEGVALEKLAKIGGGTLVNLVDITGPTAVLKLKDKDLTNKDFTVDVQVPRELNIEAVKKSFETVKDLLDVVALLVGYYAPKARGRQVQTEFKIK